MELSNLKLNRFLGKTNADSSVTQGAEEESADNNKKQNPNASAAAPRVITGSVITSCILQSSNSGNRVEIASSFNFANQNILDESFVTYSNGVPVVIIDGDGIFIVDGNNLKINITNTGIDYGSGTSADFESGSGAIFESGSYAEFQSGTNLRIKDGATFTYDNIIQPVIYYGRIKYDGTFLITPPGFSINHSSTGRYEITHNFNDPIYIVNITDLSELGGPASIITWTVESFGANSFTATSWDAAGTPTDSSFFFTVFKHHS